MSAYIISAPQTGIAPMLKDVFPGCTVKDWGDRKRDLPPSVGKAIALLELQDSNGAAEVTYKDLQGAAEVDPSNFARQVAKHPLWCDALERLGWQRAPGTRAKTFIRQGRSGTFAVAA